VLGKGIAVKYNANQLYTTDAVSDAIIRTLAKREGIPLQSFATRADMQSGSTLGSIATTRVGISSVDLGIPQLAMHSASESMCASDLKSALDLIGALYSVSITRVGSRITLK
jgi:aspartyl aminopeptidase